MSQFSESGSFIGAALDTETSGLDSGKDQIIEVGLQLFRFELPSGRILELLESHTSLQDPGFQISLEIQAVTGISPAMLIGQKIDWDQVDALLARADIVIAHNAGFDRGFVDRKSRISGDKLWACSSFQVDWRGKGFKNAKLGDLCGALGVFFSPHRAMSDVNAMVKLIGSEDVFTGKTYLAEIIASAQQEMVWAWVEGDTYEKREVLKAQNFRWSGVSKVWGKFIPASAQLASQLEFVQGLIPECRVMSKGVALRDRFKPVI